MSEEDRLSTESHIEYARVTLNGQASLLLYRQICDVAKTVTGPVQLRRTRTDGKQFLANAKSLLDLLDLAPEPGCVIEVGLEGGNERARADIISYLLTPEDPFAEMTARPFHGRELTAVGPPRRY